MPPMPRAMSRPREPVGRQAASCASAASPSRMMAPLPNCFSIWLRARSIARSRFTSMAMSHPPPHAAPGPRGPRFPETRTLYPGAGRVSSRTGYIFSGTDAPQGVPGHRRVDGPRGLQAALVEYDFGSRPGAERRGARGLDRRGQHASAARRAHAADGQVTLEGTALGSESEGCERTVQGGREPSELGDPGGDAGPQDARALEAREASQAGSGEAEGPGVGDRGSQGSRHGRHALVWDRAQELEGQVKLDRIDPADVGLRGGGADTRLRPGNRRADVRGQVGGDEAAHRRERSPNARRIGITPPLAPASPNGASPARAAVGFHGRWPAKSRDSVTGNPSAWRRIQSSATCEASSFTQSRVPQSW